LTDGVDSFVCIALDINACTKAYQNLLFNYSRLRRFIYSSPSIQFFVFPDIFPVVILYSVTSLRYCGALAAIRYGECRFRYCISHSVVILKQLSLPDIPEMMTIFVPHHEPRAIEMNFIARECSFLANRCLKSLTVNDLLQAQ